MNNSKIWNGTQQVMNYFGTSVESFGIRNIPSSYWDSGLIGDPKAAISDGSFFRLSLVGLNYKFPSKSIKKIEQLEISLYGNNLWLSTRYSGFDPQQTLRGDFSSYGLHYFSRPSEKTYGISPKHKILNLTSLN